MATSGMLRAGLLTGLVVLASAASVVAQGPPARVPTPNDTLVSPEIGSDGRVTLRIYAPRASEVALRGDWMEGAATVTLGKDDQGVWSTTVGRLGPDSYSYTFIVDGVQTVDPKNPVIKQGVSRVDNMFFLPGEAAEFQDNKPVPHGEIRKVWYQSKTLGLQRRIHIYFPPGYESSGERYPVLYLLHGGGDEDSGWSTIGRAGFILDNLLAAGRAVPMIVVMPNGSLPRPTGPADPAMAGAPQERFARELLTDIVPLVERHYRTRLDAQSRAIAGLSMGGGQTTHVVTTRPTEFAWVGVWSAGVNPQTTADFEKRAALFFNRPEATNAQIRLFSISVGDKDFALAGSQNLAEVLKKRGINHTLHVSGGGHTWINWRRYLNEFAPKLFR